MNKIYELLQELCPEGVEYKKIKAITDYEQPSNYLVKSSQYNDSYNIPVLTAGQTFILGYTDEKKVFIMLQKKILLLFLMISQPLLNG